MKTFHTESGSIYEIDEENKKARKVHGTPTERATIEWREFSSWGIVDGSLMITWTSDTPTFKSSPNGAVPATLTSRIVKEVG